MTDYEKARDEAAIIEANNTDAIGNGYITATYYFSAGADWGREWGINEECKGQHELWKPRLKAERARSEKLLKALELAQCATVISSVSPLMTQHAPYCYRCLAIREYRGEK